MQFKQLLKDDDAVSPVIGVILMVAITVILAAVIGTFVLGLGDQVQQTSPNAQFSWNEDASNGDLTLTHDGGDSIDVATLSVNGPGVSGGPIEGLDTAGTDDGVSSAFPDSDVTAGDSVTLDEDGTDPQLNAAGGEVRLIWSSSEGDRSSTLSRFDYTGSTNA